MKLGIKAIVAKDPFHIAKQVKAIENALEGTAKAIKVDYLVTVQHDTHKARFDIARPDEYARDIFTNNWIYAMLEKPTRPHIIRPRNASQLRFQSGYKAKTSPNVIASRPGGRFGPTVYTREVRHPGTKARGFSKAIAVKWRREWPRNLQRAIAAANT